MSPTNKKRKLPIPVAKKITPRVIKSAKTKPEKIFIPPTPSLRLYRRIVGGFIAAVVLVFAAVILLSTTQATIQVSPLVRTIETSFLVEVVKEKPADDQINGAVIEQTFEQTKSFSVSGTEQKEVLDKAGGEVTIINNSSKNQPLVATTRLLSSGGVLFRLDHSVMVPAGGQTVAEVHADQEGPTGDIGPDKFTIPGLATSLQKSIYAENSVAMIGGRRLVSLVTQEELDKGAEELTAEMLTVAKEQLRSQGKGNLDGEVFSSQVISKQSDTQPGEEQDVVTISLKLKVTGVFFETKALNGLAETKLFEDLDGGFVFKDAKLDDSAAWLKIEIIDVLAKNNSAELRVTVKEDSVVSKTSSFLQPEILAGKTVDEIKDYLITAGVASDVKVRIFPPWIKRIPNMIDHIIVEIEK